jgi:hypothetical protein
MDPPARGERLRKAAMRRSGRGEVLINLDSDGEEDGERPCRSFPETAKFLPHFVFLFSRAVRPRGLPMVPELPCPSIRRCRADCAAVGGGVVGWFWADCLLCTDWMQFLSLLV